MCRKKLELIHIQVEILEEQVIIFFLKIIENLIVYFIDGLHENDQVCKDLENSLNCINENGIIFLHDAITS